jgi:protein SCO1/2
VVLAALLALAAAGPAGGQTSDRLRREVAAIGVTERLGAEVPAGLAFTDEAGRRVTVGELRGRPLLLSFNYTSCPRLCSLQLAGLARALKEAGWHGQDFAVATVSIDPGEKLPQLQRSKEARVREAGGGAGIGEGWRFLAGTRQAIDALAEAVGFRYRHDPATGEFAHQATLVVITGDGRVSGYLHGISYPADRLAAALARAGAGQVASAEQQAGIGGFLLACMGLDPAGRSPLALTVMRVGGGAALLFLLGFIGLHLLRDARRPKVRPDEPAA